LTLRTSAHYKPNLDSPKSVLICSYATRLGMKRSALAANCLLSLLAWATPLMAQTPVVAPPTVGAPSVAAPAVAAPAPGVFSSFCASCAAKKAAICNGPLGTLLKNALKPLSALTGGVVPGALPPSQQELAAAGSVGASAKIKADQIAAVKRREAVRFLGTIDCHWYPEAEAGLVAALRADRSECVRYEAACSLANGCCCSKTTIEALSICVAGSERDGNPAENSLRVQLKAFEALQRCVTTYRPVELEALPRPERPASAEIVSDLPPIKLSAYYEQVQGVADRDVVAHAQHVIEHASRRAVTVTSTPRAPRSVFEIWQQTQ
jgi:hypothetical protein